MTPRPYETLLTTLADSEVRDVAAVEALRDMRAAGES
jgi:hypothetical protein